MRKGYLKPIFEKLERAFWQKDRRRLLTYWGESFDQEGDIRQQSSSTSILSLLSSVTGEHRKASFGYSKGRTCSQNFSLRFGGSFHLFLTCISFWLLYLDCIATWDAKPPYGCLNFWTLACISVWVVYFLFIFHDLSFNLAFSSSHNPILWEPDYVIWTSDELRDTLGLDLPRLERLKEWA